MSFICEVRCIVYLAVEVRHMEYMESNILHDTIPKLNLKRIEAVSVCVSVRRAEAAAVRVDGLGLVTVLQRTRPHASSPHSTRLLIADGNSEQVSCV